MAKTINPFIITGKISPQYFCGREYESSQLIRLITNGNNVVIISPRRMGKTGLIQFCYDQPKIRNEYYTFFIDILHTARHTFATTIALSNGMPIETLARALGHTNLRSTLIYARITDQKLIQDMDRLAVTLGI